MLGAHVSRQLGLQPGEPESDALREPTGTFDIAAYRNAISVLITAMEILVDNSGYPTESIAPTRTTTGRWAWASRISGRC